MREQKTLDFTGLKLCRKPFDHFTLPTAFGVEESFEILKWLEKNAPWKLVEADFYTQYEFDFEGLNLPQKISFLFSQKQTLRTELEKVFSANLSDHVDLTAHKLVKGHTIRLHNDFIPGQETYRLLIQLNRCWKEEDGGFLMLFNSSDSEDIYSVVCPIHNSMVGFAISSSSNHAVSTVHQGERYTLVYSFYNASE